MVEGRFIVFRLSKDGSGQVWSDQFGRADIYFQKQGKDFYISSGLDLLPVSTRNDCDIDHVGMMQAMYIMVDAWQKTHLV